MNITYTYYRRYNDPTDLANFLLDAVDGGVEVEEVGQVDRDSYELTLTGELCDVYGVVLQDGGNPADVRACFPEAEQGVFQPPFPCAERKEQKR